MNTQTIEIESGLLAPASAARAGVLAYKGIPYAAPPVGPLRWKAPQPVAGWSGTRKCDAFGPFAPQRMLFPDIDITTLGISEDCLSLNVWAPVDAVKLPVLFWIHGGGFAVGGGTEPRYDGANLAEKGIVVVTVNTRLNALGLLAHPELTAESEHGASGNFAMLDLIAALQWVQRNIAAFGGDASAVTIGGESAGSMFSSMLMASPVTKGLFHRVIGESGAEFPSPEKRTQSLAEAESYGLAFMKKLGVKSLAEMRALPVDALLDASPGLGFWPVADGYCLPDTLPDLFAQSRHNDVALLAGWNQDEGTNFTLMDRGGGKYPYVQQVKDLFGIAADEALTHYPDGSTAAIIASAKALGGDLVINHGAWGWIEAARRHGKAPLFRYQFNKAPKTPTHWFPKDPAPGAFHSCEIPYVFKTLDAFDWNITDADWKVSEMTANYWVNFIKTGDPNGAGLDHWPSYRNAERPVLSLDIETSVDLDLHGARHRFLADHLKP